jgi:hypothetical protein
MADPTAPGGPGRASAGRPYATISDFAIAMLIIDGPLLIVKQGQDGFTPITTQEVPA